MVVFCGGGGGGGGGKGGVHMNSFTTIFCVCFFGAVYMHLARCRLFIG